MRVFPLLGCRQASEGGSLREGVVGWDFGRRLADLFGALFSLRRGSPDAFDFYVDLWSVLERFGEPLGVNLGSQIA